MNQKKLVPEVLPKTKYGFPEAPPPMGNCSLDYQMWCLANYVLNKKKRGDRVQTLERFAKTKGRYFAAFMEDYARDIFRAKKKGLQYPVDGLIWDCADRKKRVTALVGFIEETKHDSSKKGQRDIATKAAEKHIKGTADAKPTTTAKRKATKKPVSVENNSGQTDMFG